MTTGCRIAEILVAASRQLGSVSESPRLDAELLLARAIDMPRSFLYAHPDDELDEAAVARFRRSLERREQGVPLAYICGEKEFWSLSLSVTPDTLVPRAETELLVEQALCFLPRRAERRVVDLGTGSGAIALAIAHERPLVSVTATDVSKAALAVAQHNARRLDLANVEFVCGSWAEPLAGRRFDVVVSNPPYVRDGDPALAALAEEPRLALAAGPDGLDAIAAIAAASRALAGADGALLIEHGSDQSGAVCRLLEAAGWPAVRTVRDHAGHPRVTIATP